jgi:uncharacterized protein YraI
MSYPATAAETGAAVITDARPMARWAPLTGIAFVVFFLGSMVASSVPSDNASAASWVAAYSGSGKQFGHEVTGVLLVLAALSLMSFLVGVWSRIGQLLRPGSTRSMVPLVAAGISAACIGAGGALMGSASTVTGSFAGSSATAAATVVRFANDTGFIMVAVPGMLSAALAVVGLSVQAYRARLFGRKMEVFGIAVAVILLPSLAFFPILALLIWLVITAIVLIRQGDLPERQQAGR